jgi:NhaA family Na+:H+ antiporter
MTCGWRFFFFLVGLEIKREMIEGELASPSQALLPAGAAIGGMVVPALIYTAINWGDGVALRGWAIPMATDIAFALGILVLLGNRVPSSLKVFLTAVAIIDDLGAILVIAFFYTADLSLSMLLAAGGGILVLWLLNRARVMAIGPYVVVGLIIWLCVLKSGIHATLAGVITALAIPLSGGKGGSPLKVAEHALHPWVAFAVLPMFAFVNAGVSLQGVSLGTLFQTVPLGIAIGLVAGKAVGGVRGLLAADAPGRCPLAGRRQHAPVPRRLRAVRCRVHHEPVHRRPGLRRPRPAIRHSGQAGCARGLPDCWCAGGRTATGPAGRT